VSILAREWLVSDHLTEKFKGLFGRAKPRGRNKRIQGENRGGRKKGFGGVDGGE
jgi:hypothetical protein